MAVRALGLDVGSKTIGLALSDETGMIASPLATLSRRGTVKDVQQIAEVAKRHGATQLVVGIPFDERGGLGPRARRVMVLVDALKAAGLRVDTVDETFSTREAEEALLEGELSRRRRKQVVDKVAAAVILKQWLDSHPAPLGSPDE
jgi:putative Holliday junction resolvase